MSCGHRQLISYIAPGAPATRRPATGQEPFLRPEIGFTPRWYHDAIGVNFGRQWYTDPAYRRDTIIAMRKELARRFPGTAIGGIDQPEEPFDLLTGTYGVCSVAGMYGVPIRYDCDRWPVCEHDFLDLEEIDRLEPINLDANPLFDDLLAQVDWSSTGNFFFRWISEWLKPSAALAFTTVLGTPILIWMITLEFPT